MSSEEAVRPDLLPGAEPFSAPGAEVGALVVHGFTSTPQSVRGLAEAFAAGGFGVELPRLAGHGTSLDEMLTTRWEDWAASAEAAYRDLAGRCRRVAVAGLSMGGTLALWLAGRHPEISGIVLINPLCPPPGSSDAVISGLEALAESGATLVDAIASDIADPHQSELAYERTPVAPLLSLLRSADELARCLDRITCPVLVMTSPQDHVVDPSSSEHIASSVAGPVERLSLDRSYHVATLDHDRELIEHAAVEFARRAVSLADGAP